MKNNIEIEMGDRRWSGVWSVKIKMKNLRYMSYENKIQQTFILNWFCPCAGILLSHTPAEWAVLGKQGVEKITKNEKLLNIMLGMCQYMWEIYRLH